MVWQLYALDMQPRVPGSLFLQICIFLSRSLSHLLNAVDKSSPAGGQSDSFSGRASLGRAGTPPPFLQH